MQLTELISAIQTTHEFTQRFAVQQVNSALTIRNWVIGFYIFEYEQNGEDRAVYGERVMKELAKRLKHIKGISEPQLYRFRDFYQTYPQIWEAVTTKFPDIDYQSNGILSALPRKLETAETSPNQFLGLQEKAEYSETGLEDAIITHLQQFLIEMGRGFCFEARQKRISFGNVHYRIDLVFYHRILKCHVLIDLKIGKFDHADAGQMNVYLNYYRKNEMTEHDNPPVGIILCADKDDSLVEYATLGLSQEIFVSKYLVELTSVETLKALIDQDRRRLARLLKPKKQV